MYPGWSAPPASSAAGSFAAASRRTRGNRRAISIAISALAAVAFVVVGLIVLFTQRKPGPEEEGPVRLVSGGGSGSKEPAPGTDARPSAENPQRNTGTDSASQPPGPKQPSAEESLTPPARGGERANAPGRVNKPSDEAGAAGEARRNPNRVPSASPAHKPSRRVPPRRMRTARRPASPRPRRELRFRTPTRRSDPPKRSAASSTTSTPRPTIRRPRASWPRSCGTRPSRPTTIRPAGTCCWSRRGTWRWKRWIRICIRRSSGRSRSRTRSTRWPWRSRTRARQPAACGRPLPASRCSGSFWWSPRKRSLRTALTRPSNCSKRRGTWHSGSRTGRASTRRRALWRGRCPQGSAPRLPQCG